MSLKSRLLFALIAALPAVWAAPSHATLIDYMLSPDVSGELAGGITYDVSATFDWDTTTNLESAVSIILTGAGTYAGTYTADSSFIAEVASGVPDNQDICGTDGPDSICLRFDDVLGTVPDALFGVFASDDPADLSGPATGDITGVSAAAVLAPAPTGVPEPASLALFGAGLVAFGAARKRRRT